MVNLLLTLWTFSANVSMNEIIRLGQDNIKHCRIINVVEQIKKYPYPVQRHTLSDCII